MSDFLSAAANNIGAPEELVQRSAEARAEATGASVEDILAEWAGGAAASSPPQAEAPEAEALASTPAPPAETQIEPAAPVIDIPTSPAGGQVVRAFLPTPATVTRAEAMAFDQVTTVAAAGLKERTSVRVPRWLVAIFAAIPILAGGYLIVNSGGVECGQAGQLGVDFAGNLQTCEQRAYDFTPGASGGGEGIDLVAELQAGAGLYLAECSSCHTTDGSAGVGPQLNGGAVLETWPACTDHFNWVASGSAGWSEATYGAQGKPVGGGGQMPGFIPKLTNDQITQIVLYERVTFGGQDISEAGEDCGYELEAPGVEGEPVASGVDAIAELTAGKEIYTARCQACHLEDGSQGVGPVLNGGAVLETFPACDAQVEWVGLGSGAWPEDTYGAQAKPVGSGMPGFLSQISIDEIKQVVFYERVAFGNADLEQAAADCFGA